MTTLVLFILIFLAAGFTLLAANLVLGWFIRPNLPSAAKSEVYECGEQPVGDAWIQFDLRFYVVALLFVIFDVELAFFFPWAVVFGSAVRLDDRNISCSEREAITEQLSPTTKENWQERQWLHTAAEIERSQGGVVEKHYSYTANARAQGNAGKKLAWLAFADIMVFFGVLLVGFAYLWRRGDLEWVRSTAAQVEQTAESSATAGLQETQSGTS